MLNFYKLTGLLFGFLLSFSAQSGQAVFSWTPPSSQFSVPVQSGWIIDGYKIRCTVEGTITEYPVLGYTTNTATVNLPTGLNSCHMVSYSLGSGTESSPSATVTKTIVTESATPIAPTLFDFSQQFSPLGMGGIN